MSAVASLVQVPEKADLSVRFTPEQKQIILETCCGGASESEAQALIEIAQARGLNPILGECYFVRRYDKESRRERWAVQASIDALRIKAEQTGLYAGQDEPEYEYDANGRIVLARVRVFRRDWPRPAVGVARWSEYVQTTREGNPTRFWAQMPHNQLAKCAEALALRKAFPAVLAKLYTAEEMAQADSEAPAATRAPVATIAHAPAPELPPAPTPPPPAAAKPPAKAAPKAPPPPPTPKPSPELDALSSAFEARIGDIAREGTMADLKRLAREIAESPLDRARRDVLLDIYDLAASNIEARTKGVA